MATEKKPSLLKGILNTSRQTTTKYDGQQGGVEVRRCDKCKAPRPDDADIRTCAYCGFVFMSNEVNSGS